MESFSQLQRSSSAHRLIAALLWRQHAPDERIRSFIRPDIDLEHIYQRVLWAALLRVATNAVPLNCTTFADALRDIGGFAAIGGARAISSLALDGQSVSGDIVGLLYDVRDAAVRRRLLELADGIRECASADVGLLLADAISNARATLDKLAPIAARRIS
jgi:replicative DNA helicase